MAARSKKGVRGFIKEGEGEGDVALGSEAWNVADGYTKIKILKNMIMLDTYEDVALYGAEDMEILDYMSENEISQKRDQALRRIVSTLRRLIGNVMFALRKKADREKARSYLLRLDIIERYMDGVTWQEENQLTKDVAIKINEEHFKSILNELKKIKDALNVQMNNANLIFRQSEEVDLDKIEREIVEGG